MTSSIVDYGPKRRPWQRRSIRSTHPGMSSDNARAQRLALAAMSDAERECGLTVEQIDAKHAEQRARVRARLGLS